MDYRRDYDATIEFLPVCSSCGRILYGHIDCEEKLEWYDDKKFRIPETTITPYTCPNCHAVFRAITMPTRLPFDNRSEMKYRP